MLYKENRKPDSVAMRDAYCDTLIEMAKADSSIIAVEADVMSSMGTVRFAREFPSRSINCGIQEANAVGVAAGLALWGYKPFFHAFAVFASRRVFDQVFLSCAYGGANIRIVGGDAGVTAAANGGTHMPFEDMALMRAVPNMIVIEPADTVSVREILPKLADTNCCVYMRCSRKTLIRVYEDGVPFSVGGSNVLREGEDVTIFACGIMVHEALTAAELLAEKGVSAEVVDCYSVKPLDERTVVGSAKKTRAAVTAENHNLIGGLGDAVSATLARQLPVTIEMIGVNESFGEVGTVEYLQRRFSLTAEDIVNAALRAVSRKI